MNKKGLVFQDALTAIIVVSMVIVGIGLWVGDWNTTYSSGLTYDLQDYDKLDEVASTAQSQQGNITVKSSFDTTSGDFEGTSLRGVFSVLNNIFNPFRIVFGEDGMVNSLGERWGVPNYILKGIVAIIIISITFALVAIFFRKPGGKA